MANKNGTAKVLKIITLVVIVLIPFTGYIVANDTNSRARDTTIDVNSRARDSLLGDKMVISKDKLEEKIDKLAINQATMMSAIEYIKEKV